MILRCKICGGDLEIHESDKISVCQYCGTKQTLPKLDDERRLNLYDRANHFRRNNEFDKAMSIYEQILIEDSSDAEAYWSLVLCKYGIEYVEDPSTHKRIPTVNRAQYVSIFLDENYQSAIKYADVSQRHIYEEEAKVIDEIQKGILDISSKEKPYDVFICYKETDEKGMRTIDSVLAQDIYFQLTEKGFKVFFSRITLESKIGQQYEPYIFAALNSAKVMIVIGTKPEYFNAAWVKNEWSRFVKIAQEKKNCLIIPAYKDMDPYDMPDALSYYQALDMSRIGFLQDLIHGIEKVLTSEKPKIGQDNNVTGVNNSYSTVALLKRGMLAILDEEWDKAYGFYEQVLNMDAECAEAYWGQVLAQNRASGLRALARNFISNAERQIPQRPRQQLRIADDEYRIILERVKEFSLDMDVTSLLEPVVFCSETEYLMMILEKTKENISKDKHLNRFVRFDSDNKKIEELLGAVEEEIEERSREAKLKDVANQKEAEMLLQERIATMKTAIEDAINIKGREYYRLSQIYSREESVGLESLYREFAELGKFKDAPEVCAKIRGQIELIKKRILDLEEERKETFNSLTKSAYSNTRVRELSGKLQRIDAEIGFQKSRLK